MLSNVSEPLIGVVNTAVVGQLPQPHLIGGVTVGSLIFTFLFWGFGFLRLSTSGLSAQATGADDKPALTDVIWRSLIIACIVGIALILASPFIKTLAIDLMGGSADVRREASIYFSYRIWAAPAALANFAILGWFIGQGRAMIAFVTQLFLNLTNMALSANFVLHMGMATDGVGLAVLIAEYAAVAFGLVLVAGRLRQIGQTAVWPRILNSQKFASLIAANGDIMVRTLCLLFAFVWFTSRGARSGDVTLAANSVLMHLFDVSAYLIDGFAYAAEALVGQAIGARSHGRYRQAIMLTTIWAMILGFVFAAGIWLMGPALIDVLTVSPEVREMARIFLPWAALTPIMGAACFLYDGIFTGAMATREMRNLMIFSLAIYLAASHVLEGAFGNHGLWAAMCLFFLTRSISFAARLPAIRRKSFPQAG